MKELPSGWKRIKIPDAYWFQEGPGVRNWQFKTSGIKLLNVGNITKDNTLDLDKTDRHLDPEEVEGKYKHFLVDAGDLVIASSGISFDEDGFLRTRGAFVKEGDLPLCINTSTIRFKSKEGVSDLRYFRYWLQSNEFRTQVSKFVTGSAQLNFGPSHLKKMHISLPPLAEQQRIAAILDKADALRAKRLAALAKLDTLLQSTFLHLFSDPVTNPMGWEVKRLDKFGKITTGSTPSRKIPEYYGSFIEWIKSDNINTPYHTLTQAQEFLSELGVQVGRTVPANSILITCIAGSPDCIGNAAIADREVSFNQQINALTPTSEGTTFFLYVQLLVGKKLVQNASTNSMKGMVSKSAFSSVEFISPPLKMQQEFSLIAGKIQKETEKLSGSIDKLDNLFHSLQQRAFKGQL